MQVAADIRRRASIEEPGPIKRERRQGAIDYI